MGIMNKIRIIKSRTIHHNRVASDAVKDADYFSPMCRRVSPSMVIENKTNLKFNDNVFTQCILVGVTSDEKDGYPREIEKNLIDRLTELNTFGCTITYSVMFKKTPLNKAVRMLKKAVTTNQANQIASRKSSVLGNVDLTLQFDYEDFERNLKVVHKRNQNMFHTVFTVVISADSLESLRVARGRVVNRLLSNNIESEVPFGQQLDVWKNAMPFPGYYDKGSVEMFSHEAAVIAPIRTPNNITDPGGLYFGNDKKTNKRIQIDLAKLVAQHLLFVGATGSGKTYTLLMLLMRAHDMLDKRIIFITDKADKKTNYGAVPKFYNGSHIKIGPDIGELNINPLQILFDSTLMSSNYDYVRAYNNHKGLLQQFFKEWFGGDISPNQTSYLDMYLDKVYENAGIYKENPASWENAIWPTLNDLRNLFGKDKNDSVTSQALYDKTYQLSDKGELAYINNPTNIDISKSFIVIDMSGIPEILKNAMAVLVIGILGMRFRTDTLQETIIAVDEAGSLMRTPSIIAFLLILLTKGRSYGISLWLATQQVTDLKKAGVSEEFITNMIINIVLGKKMDKFSIPIVRDYFKLNDDEQFMLSTSDVGEGLLLVGGRSMHVGFKSTEHEHNIIKGNAEIITTDNDININPLLLKLGIENGFIASNWVTGDASSYLKRNGFIPRSVINPVGRGLTSVWIKSDIIKGELIGTQSVDHYSTVLMMSAYLLELGWMVEVNHMETADILAEIDDLKLSIEYERPGSHNKNELKRKAESIVKQDRLKLFVTQSDNFVFVKNAIGDDDVVKRGGMLIHHLEKLTPGMI